MRSAVPGLPPPAPAPNSFTGEAVDHLGIPLLGFRPSVAEPELITRPPPGWNTAQVSNHMEAVLATLSIRFS